MGSQTCAKCKGTGIHILADVPGEGRIGGGRCPRGCPFPPAPADDPLMPKDVPGAAAFRDAFKKAVPPRGVDHVSWVNGYCAGWIACEKAPAPDAGAAERAVGEAARNYAGRVGHGDVCDRILYGEEGACDCGYDALDAALRREKGGA